MKGGWQLAPTLRLALACRSWPAVRGLHGGAGDTPASRLLCYFVYVFWDIKPQFCVKLKTRLNSGFFVKLTMKQPYKCHLCQSVTFREPSSVHGRVFCSRKCCGQWVKENMAGKKTKHCDLI